MQIGPTLLPALDFQHTGDLVVDFYGDLHVQSPHFARERFEADLRETLEDPARIAVFNGDLFNMDTKLQKHGGAYEATMDLDGALDYLDERLLPLARAGKIGLLSEGNHDLRGYDQAGVSPVKQLAARLRVTARYVRHGGWLWTRHGRAQGTSQHGGGPRPIQYVGYFNHGSGNGPSSTTAERIWLSLEGTDYVGLSHTHTPLDIPSAVYSPHLPTATAQRRERRVVVGASYLEYGGYALDRRYVPRPVGKVEIRLADGRKRVRVCLP